MNMPADVAMIENMQEQMKEELIHERHDTGKMIVEEPKTLI